MKSILVHVQDDPGLAARIDAAVALATACGGHVSCLHVTPLEAYVSFDSFGGVFVVKDVLDTLEEREAALRGEVEARLGRAGIGFDYEQRHGPLANMLVSRAALADVLVVGRERHREAAAMAPLSLLGDLLFRARTPLFLPAEGPLDPGGPALIAWDGSYEAANAVRAGLGPLRCARSVRVLRVGSAGEEAMFPSTRLLEYLSRHGVHAELVETEMPADGGLGGGHAVARRIVEEAVRDGAGFIVLGGYSHSRIGEYLFGGVTRDLLRECPVALLIAH